MAQNLANETIKKEKYIITISIFMLFLFWFFSVPQCSLFFFNTIASLKDQTSFCEACFSEISEITEEIS